MAPAMKGRKEAPAAGRPHTALHKPAANIGRGEQLPRRHGHQGACRQCLTRLFPNETDMPPATTIAGDSGVRAAGVTVLLAAGRTRTTAGRGGKAACVALRAGARLSSATRTKIGGPDGGQLAAPAAPEVRCGSAAPAPNGEQARASKSAATCCSGQSLLPAGEAKPSPAARGREGLGPAPSAGSKLTRSSSPDVARCACNIRPTGFDASDLRRSCSGLALSEARSAESKPLRENRLSQRCLLQEPGNKQARASRGVARLSRMEVTGARGIQAAPTGGTVGAARRPRPTHLGR